MDISPPRQRALAVVAEDEPLMRMEAADFLTDEGFEVDEAGNAAQALARIEHLGGIDLLFTDIRMPGPRDGLALAHEVVARWPDTRIVICSGMPEPAAHAMPAGAHFFSKPYLAYLVRKVLHAVNK